MQSEWSVQTEENTASLYEKMEFDRYKNPVLRIPSKWF